MTQLTLAGVACARGGRALFTGLDLALTAGAAAVVRGANGTGKSSLLRIGAGLLAPTAGNVTRDGNIALLAESAALDAEQRLGDALGWWAAIDSAPHDAVAAALADTGLTELAQVPVRWLSTGQRRRAGIARVVASGAAIWLLDEPANGLDAGAVATLERLIARHRATGGIAVIATHTPIALPDAAEVLL